MIDTDSVEYVGSHGTTVTKYSDIKKNGFRLGSGMRGKGIYFWENNVYAKELAVAWYVTATRQKDSPYRNDQQKKCAVIWAKLDAGKDEIIDFNSKIYRNQILSLIKNLKCDDNRQGAYKLYDTYIDMIEAELGYKIKFIITEVYPPTGKFRIFPTQLYGMAPCYVAREPSCINLLSCDIIKQFNVCDNIAVNQVLEEIKNETQPKSA